MISRSFDVEIFRLLNVFADALCKSDFTLAKLLSGRNHNCAVRIESQIVFSLLTN